MDIFKKNTLKTGSFKQFQEKNYKNGISGLLFVKETKKLVKLCFIFIFLLLFSIVMRSKKTLFYF